jgi:hypothetical protein
MKKQPQKNNLHLKVEGETTLFSGLSNNGPEGHSALLKEVSAALNHLSKLENSDKLRKDAIQNGKAIIKNWQPPTSEQIEKILFNMKEELLA